jgi:hypothetical protein
VNGGQELNRFQLDNHPILDHQVNAKGIFEAEAVEFERARLLPFDLQASAMKLSGHDKFIDGLQQAGAKALAYLNRSVHHFTGDLINSEPVVHLPSLPHTQSWLGLKTLSHAETLRRREISKTIAGGRSA